MSLTKQATEILHEWVQSESLRRHCYAVADSMRHFATLNGTDADLWEAVGLVHDMDYESIAQALRVDVGTVKSRLNRARLLLRRALQGIYDEQ